jgi:hypothetical protein
MAAAYHAVSENLHENCGFRLPVFNHLQAMKYASKKSCF